MKAAAILLAGGSGTRLGDARNKVYLPLAERPVLAWSLASIAGSGLVGRLVLVVRPGDDEAAGEVLDTVAPPVPVTVVHGGDTRQASELAGLEALAAAIDGGDVEVVAIHDGARPFVTPALLARVLAGARTVGGAVPALPVGRTLLRRRADGAVPVSTERVVRVQTPQAFRARELLAAERAAGAAGTADADTAETVARFTGLDVTTVAGDPANLKVTFPADLAAAEALARRGRRA